MPKGKIKAELIFADGVRSHIIEFLNDGKIKHFSEIKNALERHDVVISRELNNLIQRGWVIKKGRGCYQLDIENEKVKEYLKRLAVSIDRKSELYQINLAKMIEKSEMKTLFRGLNITISSEKIYNVEKEIQQIKLETLTPLAIFVKEIAKLRAQGEACDAYFAGKTQEELKNIFKEKFNQQLKAVIEWNPKDNDDEIEMEFVSFLDLMADCLAELNNETEKDIH